MLRAKFLLAAPSFGAYAPPSPSYGGRYSELYEYGKAVLNLIESTLTRYGIT